MPKVIQKKGATVFILIPIKLINRYDRTDTKSPIPTQSDFCLINVLMLLKVFLNTEKLVLNKRLRMVCPLLQ